MLCSLKSPPPSSLALMRSVLAASSSTVSTSRSKRAQPFPQLKVDKKPDESSLARAASANSEYEKLLGYCTSGGGKRGMERHTVKNKKVFVRERIARIADEGCEMLELGATCGMGLDYGDVPCAGTICLIAPINGVSTMFMCNDATVKGGTSYPITVTKGLRAQDISRSLRIPLLYIVDSGGAFLPLQSEIFADDKHGGRSFRNQAVMSGEGIHQVSLVSGLCTAGGAYTPTMCDEAIMVHKIGNIYLGGPPLVKAATGEVVTGEELGGATLHCGTSGIVDHFAPDEEASFSIARDVIASLNIDEDVTEYDELRSTFPEPDAPGAESLLNQISGQDRIEKEDCYAILASITDSSRFAEFKRTFGGNLICGFGLLRGRLVGFLVNCGQITAADGQKGAHFVANCDQRDIPLVFLQNGSCSGDGVEMLTDEETAGTVLKERAKFAQLQASVRVPKVTVNVGGCSGDEATTMCGPGFDPRFYFFWPRATLHRSARSSNTTEEESCAEDFEFAEGSAQFWVSRNVGDGIVLPGDTRSTLDRCLYLSMLNYEKNREIRGQSRMVVRM